MNENKKTSHSVDYICKGDCTDVAKYSWTVQHTVDQILCNVALFINKIKVMDLLNLTFFVFFLISYIITRFNYYFRYE